MRETTPDLIDWQPGQQARHNGHVVTLLTFPTSSGYSPARLGHRCRFGADCRRWDIVGPVAFAWECELASTCEQPTCGSDDFPHVGAEMPWTSPDGHITIVVRRNHFTWTVETYQGNLRVADNCGAYATETEARMVARGYAQLYRAETTPAAPLRSTPVAKGHQLDMSQSQAAAILESGVGGTIDRGAPAVNGIPTGRLTDPQIRAAAARGWVKPIVGEGRRRRIIGCQPTIAGWTHARNLNQPATAETKTSQIA